MAAELHESLLHLASQMPPGGAEADRVRRIVQLVVASQQQLQEAGDALSEHEPLLRAARGGKLRLEASARYAENLRVPFVSALLGHPDVFKNVISPQNMYRGDLASLRAVCRALRGLGDGFRLLLNCTGPASTAPRVCVVQPRGGGVLCGPRPLPGLEWLTPVGKVSRPHVAVCRGDRPDQVVVVYRGTQAGKRDGPAVHAAALVCASSSLVFSERVETERTDAGPDAVPHLHLQLRRLRVRLVRQGVGFSGCADRALLKVCDGQVAVVVQPSGSRPVEQVCVVHAETVPRLGPWCPDLKVSVVARDGAPPSCVVVRDVLLSGVSEQLLRKLPTFSLVALVPSQKMRKAGYPDLPCPVENWLGYGRTTSFFGHHFDCRGNQVVRQIRTHRGGTEHAQVKLKCQLVDGKLAAGGAVLCTWSTTLAALEKSRRNTSDAAKRCTYSFDCGWHNKTGGAAASAAASAALDGDRLRLRVTTRSVGIVEAPSDAAHALMAFVGGDDCQEVCSWGDHTADEVGGPQELSETSAPGGPLWFDSPDAPSSAASGKSSQACALCAAKALHKIYDHMACRPPPAGVVHCYFLAGTTVARLAVERVASNDSVHALLERVRALLRARGVRGVSVTAPFSAASSAPLARVATVDDLQRNLHNQRGSAPFRSDGAGERPLGQLHSRLERTSEEIQLRAERNDGFGPGERRALTDTQLLAEAVAKHEQLVQAGAGRVGHCCVLRITPWVSRTVCVLDTALGGVDHRLGAEELRRVRALEYMCQESKSRAQFAQVSDGGALTASCTIPPVDADKAKTVLFVGHLREDDCGALGFEEMFHSGADHVGQSKLTANSVVPIFL
mgnify:CR=1 FL=1|jgi:hypothetical protein